MTMKKDCSIDGCEKPAGTKKLCAMHYKRLQLHGDPLYVRPKKKCKVSGCERPHYGKGFCQTCYLRITRIGNLDAKTVKDIPGEEWLEIERKELSGIFVSNLGRMKSCRKRDEVLLKTTLKIFPGAVAPVLIASPGGKELRIGREVLQAFGENEHDDFNIVFKDKNPENCNIENLEWYGRNSLLDKVIADAEKSKHPLADCFLRFWHGDHEAISEWLHGLQNNIRAYLYVRVSNYNFPWFVDLDDCVQQSLHDVFIALYRGMFSGFQHLDGWVIKIASAALSRTLKISRKMPEPLYVQAEDGAFSKADINMFCHPSAEMQAIYNEEVVWC